MAHHSGSMYSVRRGMAGCRAASSCSVRPTADEGLGHVGAGLVIGAMLRVRSIAHVALQAARAQTLVVCMQTSHVPGNKNLRHAA